jgi:signal transduction histidine kinase
MTALSPGSTSTLPASGVGTATARMTRVLFVGTALTGIAFAALAAAITADQAPLLNPVWESIVVTALWGIPLLVIVLAWWAPLRVLRFCAVAFMAVYSAALVTWPFVQLVPRIPNGVQPWIIFLLPVTTFAAALVLPEAAAWGFLVVTCLAAGVLRFVADGSRSLTLPIEDTLFNAMYITVFVAIIIVTLRAGRQRDATAERTAADAVITAVSEAQDKERAQVAALTHDDVIATLLAAARATDATAPLVRAAASRAVDRLDDLSRVEVEPEGVTSVVDVVTSLRTTVASLTEGVNFSAPGSPSGSIPTLAARALTEATAEALRNSLRHADSPNHTTSRVVTVVCPPNAITIEVVDDGAGFDISRVSLERFGIRLSINHRMAVIDGGSALIESTPGAGTRVTLGWRQP